MAVVGINKGNSFAILPEGQTILQISKVVYKQAFNKIEVTLVNKEGTSHTERFMLNNDGGLKAFSYFAHKAVNDWENEEVDTDELIGKFLRCNVVHTQIESNKEAGKMLTFANLKDYEPATGWDDYGANDSNDGEFPDDLADALN